MLPIHSFLLLQDIAAFGIMTRVQEGWAERFHAGHVNILVDPVAAIFIELMRDEERNASRLMTMHI